MMPPGHIVSTWGIATLLQQNNHRLANLDYRLLAVGAMLPDLIDKPLVILVFTHINASQLIAHSFLFNAFLLTIVLLFWRPVLPYMLAFNVHIVADRMWNHTETFWWPVFGWAVFWQYKPMNTIEEMVNVYIDILRYPQVWVIELLALGLLFWFVRRHFLYRWPVLKRFILRGTVIS